MTDTPEDNRLEADMHLLRQQLMAARRELNRLTRTNAALEASLRHVTAALQTLLDNLPEVKP